MFQFDRLDDGLQVLIVIVAGCIALAALALLAAIFTPADNGPDSYSTCAASCGRFEVVEFQPRSGDKAPLCRCGNLKAEACP